MNKEISALGRAILLAEKDVPAFTLEKEETFEPASGFEERLLKRASRRFAPMFVFRKNGALLRRAVIAAAIVAALLLLGLSAWAVAAHIGALRAQEHTHYTAYSYDPGVGELPKATVEELWAPASLPEAYRQSDSLTGPALHELRYTSESGGVIVFSQHPGTANVGIDTENAVRKNVTVHGTAALYIEKTAQNDTIRTVVWGEGGYVFTCSAVNGEGEEELMKIAFSVAPKTDA